MWVRADPANKPADGAVLLEKGARDCLGPAYGLYVYGDGLQLRVHDSRVDYLRHMEWVPDGGIWDGAWHHVAAVAGGSFLTTHHQQLVVDGYPSPTDWNWLLYYDAMTSPDVAIGAAVLGTCGLPSFNGDIDDVRIYADKLEREQIGALLPPVPSVTTLTPHAPLEPDNFGCVTVVVTPTPPAGTVRVVEQMADGSEMVLGITSNAFCSYPNPEPPAGTYLVPIRLETQGRHRIRADFSPGLPLQASSSAVVDQVVGDLGLGPRGPVVIDGGAATTSSLSVPVSAPADGAAGMRISVDGATWEERSYQPSVVVSLDAWPGGGFPGDGLRTVSVQWRDSAGNWSETQSDSILLDRVAPAMSAPSSTVDKPGTIGGSIPIRIRWTASDGGSGIAGYDLAQSADGQAFQTVGSSLTAASLVQSLRPSHTHRFRTRAIDLAGNVSGWTYGPTFRLSLGQESNAAVAYRGTWRTATSAAYSGRRARYATAAGATATIRMTGRSFAWVASTGPTRGSARVYVNGKYIGSVNLNNSSTTARQAVFSMSWSTPAARTVVIRVNGTAGHPRVDLDAFITLK
jgi:concanavalin A-like lectin/glucanase superfamily protein